MALFDAVTLMSTNPQISTGRSYLEQDPILVL
jgi:hypothetical protein